MNNAPQTAQQPAQQTATLAQLQTRQPNAVVHAGFFDLQGFELMQRVAKAFASSTLVPQQYQGNVPNCMIALNLANRLKADELMVMQNLYIVHGNPGWSSKFLIASVNSCGRFTAMRYEWRGEKNDNDFGCRAWTIEKATGERLDGAWVDWGMVRAEGWDKKNGSKWKTMPEQMFIYRAAAFWQRAYAPEISMGLSTAEELADVVDFNQDGSFTVTSESLRADMQTVTADVVETVPQSEAPEPGKEDHKEDKSRVFTAFVNSIANAKAIDVLDVIADEIRDVPDKTEQEELRAMYQKRREELLAA